MDFTASQVEAALHELGDTWRKVSGSLRREEIRGDRNDPIDCPIAVFLRKRFPADWSVSSKRAFVRGARYEDDVYVHLPLPVTEVINRIDMGGLRNLVRRSRG